MDIKEQNSLALILIPSNILSLCVLKIDYNQRNTYTKLENVILCDVIEITLQSD